MASFWSEYIGAFQVVSGELVVADPATEPHEIEDSLIVRDARRGRWHATVTKAKFHWFDDRVVSLCVQSESYLRNDPAEWQEAESKVGVDTARAGVFDLTCYPDGDEGIANCVIPHGAISNSGFGDGIYSVFTKSQDGEVVAVLIEFIGRDAIVADSSTDEKSQSA